MANVIETCDTNNGVICVTSGDGFWILLPHYICMQINSLLVDKSLMMQMMLWWLMAQGYLFWYYEIKMFDGVVWTLDDVRYVSNLRKKFISLSTLNTLDYDFITRNEFMEVGKFSLVIMKAKKWDNLYKLIADPIQGGALNASKNKVNVDKS